jgi:hypothetical protein
MLAFRGFWCVGRNSAACVLEHATPRTVINEGGQWFSGAKLTALPGVVGYSGLARKRRSVHGRYAAAKPAAAHTAQPGLP